MGAFYGDAVDLWGVIRHMVKNMFVLQNSLQWQAWHDPLTRLYNRGALFEKASGWQSATGKPASHFL